MSLTDALDTLTADITARGIHATRDPRNIAVPGALVALDSVGTDHVLCGATSATVTVWLIVSGNGGHPHAEDELLTMFAEVSDLSATAETADLALPDGGTYPAFKLTVNVEE